MIVLYCRSNVLKSISHLSLLCQKQFVDHVAGRFQGFQPYVLSGAIRQCLFSTKCPINSLTYRNISKVMIAWRRFSKSFSSKETKVRLYSSAKVADPLRILFCGSDEFSIYSLNALHEQATRHRNLIASIDVVCRPGKRVGRGLREIRHGS